MRKLTSDEIEKFASRKGVRRRQIENFLGTMGTDISIALANATLDARLYDWDSPTLNAVICGIQLAYDETRCANCGRPAEIFGDLEDLCAECYRSGQIEAKHDRETQVEGR